jgi:hypothetical protein
MTEWMIKGFEVANCNCATGCPCQFMSAPTSGNCRAGVGIHIDEGHHGKVKLDGLNIALTAAWPGRIHEGHGEMQYIIDERASAEQRAALLRILRGDDSEPGANAFKVYSSMCEKFYEPMYKPISVKSNRETCESLVDIPGVLHITTTAIRNPVTGVPHQVQVKLPHGFEYDVAHYAAGNLKSDGPIRLETNGSHAHLAAIHMTDKGVVH